MPLVKTLALAAALALGGGAAGAQTVMKVGSTPTGVPFTFLDPKQRRCCARCLMTGRRAP